MLLCIQIFYAFLGVIAWIQENLKLLKLDKALGLSEVRIHLFNLY